MTTQQYGPASRPVPRQAPAHRPPSQPHSPVVEKVTTLVTPIEPKGMMVLRAITYMICSLAATVFLLLVLYVNNKINEFQETMQNLFGGPTSTSSPFPTQPPNLFGN